jgi:hypothetical protein
MDSFIGYILQGLFLFSIAFSVGALLLLLFVRACSKLGLLTEGEGKTMREFFKNFA